MVKSSRAKRMDKHHRRNKGSGGLNLVSLMDIFTILVFFLLVNSSDVEVLPNAKEVQLPESIAEQKAKETVVIVIGEQDIIVQGSPVVKVADVMDVHIERVRDAYPLYELRFPEKKKRVFDELDQVENLVLAGRTGLFWYNNMDHSIENGFDVVRKLLNEVTTTDELHYWNK